MAKPTAAWGIDIGQCALKALKLELVDGQPTATAFDYIEHPKILSQPDADPELLTREALEKFLSRNELGSDIVAIGVPGQSGLARFVKLPPVEPSKIPSIVNFEAKQQIPFPLDEVVWDFQTISGGEVVNNFAMETEIGLFAMKKDVIAKYMGQFNAVNIETHVVQMAPLALCNYATYELLGKGGPNPVDMAGGDETPRGKKRCVVVLDVGTDASNLIITDAGKIIWQRPLPLGGNHFTRALTKEMKLTFAKAEHLKRNAAKSPDLASILKALRPVLTDFVGEVQRSLGYFTNTHRDAHVASLVGLGSAFRLPGLQKYMSEKLSLEVQRPQSVERLGGDAVKSDPVFIDNVLTFPVAYGLALQGLNELGERKDYGRINTNLLPGQIKIDRMIRGKKPWVAAAAACLLLGTGGLALGYGAQYASVTDPKLKAAMKEVKGTVDSAKSQSNSKSTGEADVAKIGTEVKAIIKGNDNRLDMVRLNEVLLAALPRHGDAPLGNMTADQAPFHRTQEGSDALRRYMDRIKNGVTLDQIAEDDKADALANVQIESVAMEYTDNLAEFLKKADAKAFTDFARNIADQLPDAEKEQSGQRMVPKADPVGGYIFQVCGYTLHDKGLQFLENALVKNFRESNRFASATLAVIEKDGKKFNEVDYFLPGVTDPAKGRISHVFLLLSKQVENPQPKYFQFINNQNYIFPLLPPPGAVDPATGAAAPAAPVDPAAAGGATAQPGANDTITKGWTSLTATAANPPDTTAAPVDPKAKKRIRHEFVLVFVWRDTTPAAPGTPGTPTAPTPAPGTPPPVKAG